MAVETHEHRWLGKSVKRKEDGRFVVGKGNYVDDITLPGMLHMAILRSPFAHARIRSIKTEAAQALPGVVAVVTGELLAQPLLKGLPPATARLGLVGGQRTFPRFQCRHHREDTGRRCLPGTQSRS